ncbi:hypothetical protein AVEN_140678-1 [Araneus ventricosus]|uniref:Uncharacterized protein n=1 Tax=Araneus ventricosus TaxID=182803 RepID=A0A4Y2C614_ARAVE|nr:hypothetical protein AVEN_140678-1 [Araneus ventricosus]
MRLKLNVSCHNSLGRNPNGHHWPRPDTSRRRYVLTLEESHYSIPSVIIPGEAKAHLHIWETFHPRTRGDPRESQMFVTSISKYSLPPPCRSLVGNGMTAAAIASDIGKQAYLWFISFR